MRYVQYPYFDEDCEDIDDTEMSCMEELFLDDIRQHGLISVDMIPFMRKTQRAYGIIEKQIYLKYRRI